MSLFFDDLLDAKVREFNPRYADGPSALLGAFRLLHSDIYGNRDFVEYLRNRGKFYDHEEKRERDLILIDFDRPANNVFEVTEEWAFHNGHYGTREDVVFLINGIPVLVIECKNANKDEAIALGVDQIRRYHRETPELFVGQQLFTATDAIGFSYGVTWNTVRRNIFNWKRTEGGLSRPLTESGLSSPLTERGLSSPLTAGRLSSPLTERGLSSPLTERGLSSPLTERGLCSPLTERGLYSPLTERGLCSPLTERGLCSPLTASGLSSPLTESGLSSPLTERGLSSPLTEGRGGQECPPSVSGGQECPPSFSGGQECPPSFFDPYGEVTKTSHRLAHWQQGQVWVFVTWRLRDSLPKAELDQWQEERRIWLALHPEPWDERTEAEYHDRFSTPIVGLNFHWHIVGRSEKFTSSHHIASVVPADARKRGFGIEASRFAEAREGRPVLGDIGLELHRRCVIKVQTEVDIGGEVAFFHRNVEQRDRLGDGLPGRLTDQGQAQVITAIGRLATVVDVYRGTSTSRSS